MVELQGTHYVHVTPDRMQALMPKIMHQAAPDPAMIARKTIANLMSDGSSKFHGLTKSQYIILLENIPKLEAILSQ